MSHHHRKGGNAADVGRRARQIPSILLLILALLIPAPFVEGEDRHPARPEIPSAKQLAKLRADGGRKWNRLVFEKSPYLLQHAANPVDWFPWGDEAFEKAKREGKMVFVSIGYSTCHWCHVMERETFEDPAVAKILNKHYVSIKVDREERPDVDRVYMSALRALRNDDGGGWPLNVFLTPGGELFFGGTYFPPVTRQGRRSFTYEINRLAEAWETGREELLKKGKTITARLRARETRQGSAELDEQVVADALSSYTRSFDKNNGGFGIRQKFPMPHRLSFLLRHWRRTGDRQALSIAELTLDKIALGGIADHVGGGFHRYTVDSGWHTPHFEKMLYDQALLATAFIEAYQVTGNKVYAAAANGIFAYVLRDMTDAGGGFYSAEDADSEGEEGRFYVWTYEEVLELLGDETGRLFCGVYHVTEEGNFEKGQSILHLGAPLQKLALYRAHDPNEFVLRMADARNALLRERSNRTRPHLDDKVITSWNGLMISAFALGARVTDNASYLHAAERAARFVLSEMRTGDGELYRRYRQGHVAIPGTLDDYAFFANALIDLYEASYDPAYLSEAIDVANRMDELFGDTNGGGYFLRSGEGEELLVRMKVVEDGAIPSGNSIAALVCFRLWEMTGRREFEERGSAILDAFSVEIRRNPAAHAQMFIALDYALGPNVEVVIAGDPDREDTKKLLAPLRRQFLPHMAVTLRLDGERGEEMTSLAPFLKEHIEVDGRATAYVCRDHACLLPTRDATEMMIQISKENRK